MRQLFSPSGDDLELRGLTVQRTRKRIPGACYKCCNPGHRRGHCPLSRYLNCGHKGHTQRFFKDQSFQTSTSAMKVGCYFCERLRHFKQNCPFIKCKSCGLKGHAKWICPTREVGPSSQSVIQSIEVDVSDSEVESQHQ